MTDSFVELNGDKLYPNTVKIDIKIQNYPFHFNHTRLCLLAEIESTQELVLYAKNEKIKKNKITFTNQSEVITGSFNWHPRARSITSHEKMETIPVFAWYPLDQPQNEKMKLLGFSFLSPFSKRFQSTLWTFRMGLDIRDDMVDLGNDPGEVFCIRNLCGRAAIGITCFVVFALVMLIGLNVYVAFKRRLQYQSVKA
eukprot:TRINITY_DN4735_c0_g1_i11.p1 TRINITY_DN4735_c0_g1~~TRINITY_DN4735_c0_g1_i11.p1  ORF type:complete len:197 (+),score=31.40 TRINITY_DN4735_c0_g1_i11:509-1099(+)